MRFALLRSFSKRGATASLFSRKAIPVVSAATICFLLRNPLSSLRAVEQPAETRNIGNPRVYSGSLGPFHGTFGQKRILPIGFRARGRGKASCTYCLRESSREIERKSKDSRCAHKHRSGNMHSISIHLYGCRVAQRLFERVPVRSVV